MKMPLVIPGSKSGKAATFSKDAPIEKTNLPDVNDSGETEGFALGEKKKADWPFYFGLLVATLLFFFKTVFFGLSISKLSRVAAWDSMFDGIPAALGAKCDPSVVQLIVPYDFLLAKIWHAGLIPVWNPYSGFGCPLIGDLQASMFSPVRALFMLFPTSYVYNLTLVLQVVLAAVGTYGLCRALKLSRLASSMAAISYAFCPYMLWYLELTTGISQCLYPLVAWSFVQLANKKRLVDIFYAALASSALVACGHPESAFYGITIFSLLATLLLFVGEQDVSAKAKQAFALIGGVAISTFCFSAPILFPFVEFLCNSDSYKYQVARSAYAPWQGIAYNLLQPGFGAASPYAGIVAAACLIFSLFVVLPKNKTVRAIGLTGGLALMIASRLGPMDSILSCGVSAYLITVYCLPIVLLMAIVISAFGLQEVMAQVNFGTNKRFLLLVGAVATALFVPLLLHLTKVPLAVGNFDLILPSMSFNQSAWKHDLILSLLFVLVIAAKKFWPPRYFFCWAASILAIGFVSQATLAKSSLPIESKFDYPLVAPIPFLQEKNCRTLSACDHLFRADTNAVYGVNEIQSHNPLYPKRYLNFMRALGAQVTEFSQSFAGNTSLALSPVLNLASVRYVLSLLPVKATDESAAAQKRITLEPINFGGHAVVLKSAALVYDQANAEISGQFDWSLGHSKKLTYSLIILNNKKQLVWFGDGQPLKPLTKFACPVPQGLQGQEFSLAVQVFDWQANRALAALRNGNEDSPVIADIHPGVDKVAFDHHHYRFVSESANKVRIYENTMAAPKAFIVHAAAYCSTEAQALKAITAPGFDYRKQVVLEIGDSAFTNKNVSQSGLKDSVELVNINSDTVQVKISTDKAGYLVLTDQYYPGWTVSVDGRQNPLLRANYLFRATPVPAGKHVIVFSYRPGSFYIGGGLFALMFSIFLIVGLTNIFSSPKKEAR